MKIRSVSFCVLLIAMATGASAESLVDGSIEAGQSKSLTCAACHGTEGNSMNPLWPNLAGQNANYIVAQLNAFKSIDGEPAKRSDPLMGPMALPLTDQDMNDLAVYFESLPAAANSVRTPQEMSLTQEQKDELTIDSVIAAGEALYRAGDVDRKIPACMSCHGPSGRGNPAATYPSLHGQHATYTAKQLRDYRSGARTSDDPTEQMREIAQRLTDVEIEVIASYIQGLK